MIYSNIKELTQDVFKGQPNEVNWVGIDFDGLMKFGKSINPRYTYSSERWRGFEQIGKKIPDSGYRPLSSLIRRDDIRVDSTIIEILK